MADLLLATPAQTSAPAVTAEKSPAPATKPNPQSTTPASVEDIAIIGMSCHYPNSPDPQAYWHTIVNNLDVIGPLPAERKTWSDPALFAEGDTLFRAGYIEGMDLFDPDYFNISPREARMMDPQQRLMLEHSVKTLCDAGYEPERLKGTDVGVFVGIAAADYQNLLVKHGLINSHYSTGVDHSLAANRVSFHFDWHGPSESVNTACSSALVALHRARLSLLAGECSAALVGGIGCVLQQELTAGFHQAGMLSPDNRCKTFDEQANGYVRAEGIGVVMLKPQATAQQDGDRIYALIKGSASNHGGAVRSLTVPNPDAQQAVIDKAVTNAGMTLADIQYIEAHGTGTKLGDPVEANGLKRVAQQHGFNTPNSIALGSVKANIGHQEAGAGIAGVIKVLLMMKHRTMVANSALNQPNQYLQLEDSPFYLPTQNKPWQPPQDQPMRAGVSSFGFGGANAHVVLESCDPSYSARQWPANMPYCLLLSATCSDSLTRQADQALAQINQQPLETVLLASLEHNHHAFRLVVTGDDREQFEQALSAFTQGKAHTNVLTGQTASASQLFNQELEADELVDFLAQKGKWSSLLKLWSQGIDLNWHLVVSPTDRAALPLPKFNKQSYWFTQIKGASMQPAPTAALSHAAPVNGKVQLLSLDQFGPTESAPSPVKPAPQPAAEPVIAPPPAPAPITPPPMPASPAPSIDTGKLESSIKRLLADVLLMSEDEVTMDMPLAEMGLDSILTVEFIKAVNQELETTLNASDLYECYNLEKLMQKLAAASSTPTTPPPAAPTQPAPPPVAEPAPTPVLQPAVHPAPTAIISMDTLTELMSDTLCCDPGEVGYDTPFSELGLDSILGVEFIKGINDAADLNLTADILFEHVTLQALNQAINGAGTAPTASAELDDLLQQVYQGELSADDALKRGV